MTSSYDFHGVPVEVSADDRTIADAIDNRLRWFRSDGRQPAPRLAVRIGAEHVQPPDERGRPVYDAPVGNVLYFEDSDQLFIDTGGRLRVLCEPGPGVVTTALDHPAPTDRWLASHALLTIPLIEVLKREALYCVHAGCLAADGRGLLLAGTSGAGKSTLAVALLRRGLDFLADDMVFLQCDAGALRVLAFPDEIDLADDTIGRFAELAFLLSSGRQPGATKRQLRAEDVYRTAPVMACRPAVLVVLTLSRGRRSQLSPLPAGEALLELVPNVLLTEPCSSQAHLDALAELARTTTCYRLAVGDDFDELVELLAGLVGR